MSAPTTAERLVLDAVATFPRTPAVIKRYMTVSAPVQTVRNLLGTLQAKGLVEPAPSDQPGATRWRLTPAGLDEQTRGTR